jgi:phage-related protein
MFYGKTFIFDGQPSEFYNLYLGELNGSGEGTTTAQDVTLLTQKVYRRPVPLLYGAEQTPVLSFPLSFYSPDEITAESLSEISGWLFSQQNYKVLRICQNDMSDIYFNCFLTAPQITRVGNIIQAISCTVMCYSRSKKGEKIPSCLRSPVPSNRRTNSFHICHQHDFERYT